MRVSIFYFECMLEHHLHSVLEEARRGCQVLWNNWYTYSHCYVGSENQVLGEWLVLLTTNLSFWHLGLLLEKENKKRPLNVELIKAKKSFKLIESKAQY